MSRQFAAPCFLLIALLGGSRAVLGDDEPVVARRPWSEIVEYIEQLDDTNAEVRQQAAQQLEVQIPLLCPWDLELEAYSEYAIARAQGIREAIVPSIPLLLKAAKGQDDGAAYAAIAVLGFLGERAPAALPFLREVLTDVNAEDSRRFAAVLALLYVTPPDEAVGPYIVKAMRSTRPETVNELRDLWRADVEHTQKGDKEYIAVTFAGLGLSAVPVTSSFLNSGRTKVEVPSLVELMQPEFPETYRALAMMVLAEFEEDAEGAIPALRKLLADKDPVLRQLAASTLLAIEKDEAKVPEILDSLQLKEAERRTVEKGIREGFENMRREDQESMEHGKDLNPELLDFYVNYAAHHRHLEQRRAIKQLGYAGPQAKRAIPLLVKSLESDDRHTRKAAFEALQRIDPERAKSVKLP